MKLPVSVMAVVCACACSTQAQTSKEEQCLFDTMIPMAHDFIARNALSFDTNFGTNAIKRSKITIWDNKPGWEGLLVLTNGWTFSYLSIGTNVEIDAFQTQTRTGYYNPSTMPKGEVEAVKALNLRNKLTDKKALDLLKWHFKTMGHKEKDFHPPEFFHLGGDPGVPDYFPVPFYKATWYRKDVNVEADSAAGKLMPNINITISGITTNIIDYDKAFMPVGHDF